MPEWGRVLLGGIGCFLLAWANLGLAADVGEIPLWLADALLIFLVLDRSGHVLAINLAAGAVGVLLAYLLATQVFVAPALLVTAASILHVALARFLLVRFAPEAARLETAGALVHLFLWCALLSPIAGAIVMAGVALSADGWMSATQGFVFWWTASAVGTAILLPFILSLVHSAPVDLQRLRSRWREALVVVTLVALAAAMGRHSASGFSLILGLPVLLWAALRLDFRCTSLLCVLLALLPIAGAAVHSWPFHEDLRDTMPRAQELQAYLLVIVLPALFASLFTQEQRAGDGARQAALQALHAVMDAVPAAIMTLTPGGKIDLWSRGAERIFGWRRDEVEGREPLFVTPEHGAEDASLRQRVLAGNEIRDRPAQRRNRADEARDFVINAAPMRDSTGAVTEIISVMDDVTDRHRLASSREQHRAHLAAILDAVADPIITIDEDGIVTSFSRAAEAVFGYEAAEVMGRNLSMLMPEPHHSHHDAYLRRYRETGIARIIGASRAVTARRKDGSLFPAEITISEAWVDGRRIFAGIVRDLSAKPGTATTEEPPRQADRDTAKFLSTISHDLRQPLQALSLVTGALERRATDPATRELVDHLGAVVRSTQATFENIVEWTRIENGLVAAVPVATPARDLLASLAAEFEEAAARGRLQLRCVPTRAIVVSDPAVLRRILRHLLDNAVKFTPAGKILIGARRRGPMLRMMVADSGLGIDMDQRDAIFAEFSQLDAGREAGGLGLGLAIARRLANLMDSRVGFRSAPEKGSVFWIDVPLSGA